MSANLDIELLRTFHAILRFGRFLAAASHLNRSPSAVSTHVRRLEELAGGRLFERDNQSVRLTPLGQRFQRQTAELLETHDRVLAGLRRREEPLRVRFGISEEYAGKLLLLEALGATGRRWRTVVSSPGAAALEAAIEGGLAIGVIDRARVGPTMRVLGPAEGFAELPAHRIRLAFAPGERPPALERLGELIAEEFRLCAATAPGARPAGGGRLSVSGSSRSLRGDAFPFTPLAQQRLAPAPPSMCAPCCRRVAISR